MANINVAIKRTKLIASVKEAIASREKDVAEADKINEANHKARKAWELKQVLNVGEAKSTSFSPYSNEVTIVYALKTNTKPPENKPVPSVGYQVREELAVLKNGLKLLELSDEEVIKTASYGTVSKYL